MTNQTTSCNETEPNMEAIKMMAMGKFTKECSEVFLFPTYDHGIKMKTYGISIVHLYISILCVLNNIFSDRLT